SGGLVTFFFFSSRRRHTRFSRDWSQTCALPISRLCQENQVVGVHSVHISPAGQDFTEMFAGNPGASEYAQQLVPIPCIDRVAQEIGRASCRDRVEIAVDDGSLQKKGVET